MHPSATTSTSLQPPVLRELLSVCLTLSHPARVALLLAQRLRNVIVLRVIKCSVQRIAVPT